MIRTFTTLRRGFTLMETVLVIAVGLGLLIGGIVFYQQSARSSDLLVQTRNAIGIASEARSLFFNRESYGAAGEEITDEIIDASASPATVFSNTRIFARDQGFAIEFFGLDTRVCRSMVGQDHGLSAAAVEGNSMGAASCADGGMTIHYLN